MSDYDSKNIVGDVFHAMRAEAKKAKRTDPDGIKRVCQAMYDEKPERGSIYPPGWSGEEW